MSNLIPLLLAGTGASALSVGGLYLIHQMTKSKEKTPEFESVEDFKNGDGEGCVGSLFSGVDLKGTGSLSFPSDKDSYFGAASTESQDNGSCLVIEWKKNELAEGDSKKWDGIFTWLWAFRGDSKGFITFNVAKTNASKNLSLTGITYFLDKNADNKWEVKSHKEVTGKEIDSTSFESKFPKEKGGDSKVKNGDKTYWGFAEGASKLYEICEGVKCTGSTTPSHFKGKWVWKKENNQSVKVNEWGKDLEWWDHMYSKSEFDMETKLNGFAGAWSEG